MCILPHNATAPLKESPARVISLTNMATGCVDCYVQAVFHAERGLEWVVFAQKHQNRFVTAAANWSCATVTVVFYATFLPILVCARPAPTSRPLCMSTTYDPRWRQACIAALSPPRSCLLNLSASQALRLGPAALAP